MIAPARRAAFDALLAHDERGTDLPATLAAAHASLTDPRDHTLLTELVTGVVRMQRALDFQLSSRTSRPLERLDPAVRVSLRLAAFQLLYLDRVPASAAVDDAVSLTRRAGKTSAAGLVNAVLRALARERTALTWPEAPEAEALGVRYSHPQWLVDRWVARYGIDRTRSWLVFNNAAPRVALAANRSAADRDGVAAELAREGVQTEPATRAPDGLLVVDGAVVSSAAVREGRCVIQDEASQLVGALGDIAPGDRVLDLCAAPGGKTVALAARVGPAGLVVASDVRPRRVRLLQQTIRRTHLPRTVIVQVPGSGALPFRPGAFDLVLVDAPCSGLGTLRRDPDIRWRCQPEHLPRLARAQVQLLERAAPLVRPGGQLVYATCSSEPDENDEVVAAFLSGHPEFGLRQTHRTLPPEDGLEAFYGAVIARNL